MEIVFVWLNNYRNLNNLQFNLGSDYLYKLKYDEEQGVCKIERTSNKTYISDFFQPYLNISAIVGENASGKSSILNALRQALEERRDYIEYFILFKDKDGNLYSNYFFGYEEDEQDDFVPHNKNVEMDIRGFEIKSENASIYDTIFFSQIIDLTIYPVNHDSPLGIDISSNWLSFEDIKNTPENSGSKNLEYHKHCDSLRQINFCLSNKEHNYLGTMVLPEEVEIHFSSLNYTHHNTNYSLRGYDTILIERLTKEINQTEDSKKRCFLYFLHDMISCIYKNFEIRNHYLSSKIKIEKSKEEISSLPIENAVKEFIIGQNLFDGKPTIELIEIVNKTIEKSNDVGDSHWSIQISEITLELINKYDIFLYSLKKFSPYGSPYGFISFDWRNLSTGEKAFLNLYSRFFHAKDLILKKIEASDRLGVSKRTLPNAVYILIDEGELGFHLQWQKDYIGNLVKNIPKILSFEDHEMDYQIIFTTHSPMSLSDMPNDRILYICNGTTIDEKMRSFGANISDLITHSFFIKDGLVGSFAIDKINNTIKWLNDEGKANAEYHKTLIQNIDEPLVNRKLTEMFIEKMGDEESKNIAKENLLKQINEFKNKYGEELL